MIRQNRHTADRPRSTQVVSETDLGVFHLASAGLVPQMLSDLIDHANAGGANRMAKRFKATRGVHGNLTTNRGTPFFNVFPAFALFAQAQVFVVEDLSDGEAVMTLDEIDVLHRHTGLLV